MSNDGYTQVKHEKPFRYDEDGLHVTRGAHGRDQVAIWGAVSSCTPMTKGDL